MIALPKGAVLLETDGPRRRIRMNGVSFWVTSEPEPRFKRAVEEALVNFFGRLAHVKKHEDDYYRSVRLV